MTTTNPLERAAELLRGYAHELQEGHTSRRAPDDWTGEDEAKAAYDEHLAVAAALERERARVQELEEQLAAIGAGGVEPLRMPAGYVRLDDVLERLASCCGASSAPVTTLARHFGARGAEPDLAQLTKRGATAWAGVDAQALRDGEDIRACGAQGESNALAG